jgi:hypothetical protein
MATPGVTLIDQAGNALTFSGGNLPIVNAGTGVQVAQATTNIATPQNGSNVTLRTGAGRLFTVTVTTVGSVTPLVFTDNGVTIFTLSIAQNAAIGTYPANIPFTTNLVVVGGATNAAISSAIGF